MSENKDIIENGSTKLYTVEEEEEVVSSLNVVESDNIPEEANALVNSANSLVKGIWGSEGRRVVAITNNTGKPIQVKFSKNSLKNTKKLIENEATSHYSIKPRDGLLGTKNYLCEVWYDDKYISFYAYGETSPRLNNQFEVTSNEIILKANDQIPQDSKIHIWPKDSQEYSQVDNQLILL